MKESDWNKMMAAQLEEEKEEDGTTTTAATTKGDDDDDSASVGLCLSEDSDVSDHELRVAAGFENRTEAEVADEEHTAVFS